MCDGVRLGLFDIEGGLAGGPFVGLVGGAGWNGYPQPWLPWGEAVRAAQGIGGRAEGDAVLTPVADAEPGAGCPMRAWRAWNVWWQGESVRAVPLGHAMWYWQELR